MIKRVFAALAALALALTVAAPARAKELPAADVAISTVGEFLTFAENCRLDSYSRDLVVVLREDLDLTGVAFDGIPVFCGTFLGDGHSIIGLSLTGSGSVQGLFRYLTDTALVRDLTVEGTVAPQGSRSVVGGIAGSNEGTVRECRFTGTVGGSDSVGGIAGSNGVTGLIENCQTAGTVYGVHHAGGIAGVNSGVIRSCVNTAGVNTTAVQNSVDLSDITLESLTGSESTVSVTDIGGIAGSCMGVIRGCDNRGDVGYPHMGYNIGGIAGSQTGYIADCRNYGQISGRKEVGGIVGQMEPVTRLDYSEDSLQILRGHVDEVGSLAGQAADNAQSSASAVGGYVSNLRKQSETARDALDQLIPDLDEIFDPETYDIDRIRAAQSALGGSISAMSGSVRSILSTSRDGAAGLGRDVMAVVNRVNVMGEFLNHGEEYLGGSVRDVSDEDTEADVGCETSACANFGPVLADLNAGGIVGAMAFENELDHEDDLQVSGELSLNFESEMRAVIRDCRNSAAVTVRRQNAGGIVGWQYLGLIRDCVSSGELNAAGADCVGGIVGRSGGYLRSNAVKCVVAGGTRVGGIAGVAAVVTDHRSMAKLSGSEKVGAVLGEASPDYHGEENPIAGNFYLPVESDRGGIDGISYAGLAQPLEAEEFLTLEHLPELFRVVTIRFVADGSEVERISLEPGGRLDPGEIPAVPPKEGWEGEWDDLDPEKLEGVLFDLTFTAAYTGHLTVIQSETTRNGLPLLLAEGDFTRLSAVTAEPSAAIPPLEERETHLESWLLAFDSCGKVTGGHILVPDGADSGRLRLYFRGENGWKEAAHTVSGRYLVFELTGQETELALVQAARPLWPLFAAGGAVILLAVIVIAASVRRRRRKKAAAATEN